MKNLILTLTFGIISSLLFTEEVFAQTGSPETLGQPEIIDLIGFGDIKGQNSSSSMNIMEVTIPLDPEFEQVVIESPVPQTAVVFDASLMQQQEWLTPVLQNIEVYPMPANDFVFIELEKSADYEVNIINIVGQVVSSETVTDTRKHRLDISNLPTGIYLLNFTSGIEMNTKRINVK